MSYLSRLAHLISRRFASRPLAVRHLSQRRTLFPIFLALIGLIFAQPLLVNAEPAMRVRTQLAEMAQGNSTEEATEEPTEEATGEEGTDEERDEEDAESDATPTLVTPPVVTEEPTEATPPADQINIEVPTTAATGVLTVEIPLDQQSDDTPGQLTEPAETVAVPFAWQGDATIRAQELGDVSPPLQAEVLQGDFQISYVAAPAGSTTGEGLRILPVTAPGTLRLGLKLDASSTTLPFPAGATLLLQLAVRVYAPDATARLIIADDLGSSSVTLEGLNWTDYQVTRQIDASADAVELMLEWRNVPANGWLEMRNLSIARLSTTDSAAVSPTDTPVLVEEVTIAPTAPLATPTPKSTRVPLATATPLPTIVAGTAAPAAAASDASTITDTAVLTPTPTYIVVTSTPTPVDIYQQATRVAQATEWAQVLGPATATPPNLATPTPTITPFVIVVVNTPTPENAATATEVALYATAVAFTTGTPTPYPAEATVAVATQTVPPPTRTPRPTATPTPLFVLLENIPVNEPAPPPLVPGELYGKIIFLTDFRGDPRRPNAMIMNPDGSEVALLTTNTFYYLSAARDSYSADQRYHAYNLPEAGGEAHNAGRLQIFYNDYFYDSLQHQLTYFGAGVAWAPAWSPTSETIAFVSSESQNDEIWVMQRGQWPASQLTKNEWEWDHHPSFSPDGGEIVFSSNRVTGKRQIWMMSSSGGDQRQITNFTFEAWDPVWVKYVEGQ